MRTSVSLIHGYRWSAIFLYVYTGRIAFSAIGSQDVSSSKTKETQDGFSPGGLCVPQDSGGFGVPPLDAVVVKPYSPKSIYRLAEKVCPPPLLGYVIVNKSSAQVGLTGLCDTAFEDIRSKLDEDNIVGELFSRFTAE